MKTYPFFNIAFGILYKSDCAAIGHEYNNTDVIQLLQFIVCLCTSVH